MSYLAYLIRDAGAPPSGYSAVSKMSPLDKPRVTRLIFCNDEPHLSFIGVKGTLSLCVLPVLCVKPLFAFFALLPLCETNLCIPLVSFV